ncbi:molybdopterin-synthase adenylyltransferase MoeB [Pedobacter sp. MW01-1-1]|uniref:molybdopterin-synthase adenylyltransferase MoeB n=1 Tax=Pedobacter sp. MW01-1-1 TaxID=3383027 RepID=UPI003FEE36E5
MLQNNELKQYNRQIILPEFGMAGQEKLKVAKVLIIGAGGLGCPVLQYLAAAGVGHIGLVDDDLVDVSNLHRQILFSVADVGQAKVLVAKKKLEILNPLVSLLAFPERITPENAARLIEPYDLIVDGSDNFPTRYLVNDTCVALNKPLVFGSIFKFEGQVSVFNYQNGPNYRDVFPEAPEKDEVPNCAEIGVIGVLPGIIGSYMANEVIKVIAQLGETLSGSLLTINTLNNSTYVFKIGTETSPSLQAEEEEKTNLHTETAEISMEILNTWLQERSESVYLVDVRETYEFEEYNIGGHNIPFYELQNHLADIPSDRKLVFICQSGQRSKMAINLARPQFKGEMFSVKNGLQNGLTK